MHFSQLCRVDLSRNDVKVVEQYFVCWVLGVLLKIQQPALDVKEKYYNTSISCAIFFFLFTLQSDNDTRPAATDTTSGGSSALSADQERIR